MKFQSVIGVVVFEEGALVNDNTYSDLETDFYTLISDGGKEYPLKFETVTQASQTPINRRIALSISAEPDSKGLYFVSTDEKYYTFVSSFKKQVDDFTISAEGKPKELIALFRSIKPTTLESRGGVEGEWYASEWESVKKAAYKIWAFYTDKLGHTKDYEVRGYCLVTESTAGKGYYLEDIISEYKQSEELVFGQQNTWKQEFEEYKFKWYHAWSGSSSSYCGWGRVGSAGSMTYQSCTKGWKTMVHELGHNFGRRHSQRIDGENPNWTVSEYGDNTCRMGQADAGFNSIQALKLGGVPNHLVASPSTESEKFVLVPLELSEHAMHPGEVKIVNDGYFYYSTRDKMTNPWDVPNTQKYSTLTSNIYTHSYQFPNMPDSSQGSNRGKTQLWGESAPDNDSISQGISSVNTHENFVKRVLNFTVDGQEAPDPVIQTGFPKHVPGVSLEEWHSGLWYNPNMDGQGFDIHIKNGKLVLVWYTYDRDLPTGGTFPPQRFYIASCNTHEGLEEFDIVTTEGGTFSDPSQRVEKTIGKGQLYFFSDTQGVFLYDTEEHGYGAVEITNLVKTSDDSRNGFWWDSARAGEGLTFNMLDQNRCIGYLYTYDRPKTMYYGTVPRSTQRWYLFEGIFSTDDKGDYFQCKIYQPWKGQALSAKLKYDPLVVGTGQLRFTNKNQTCWTSFDIEERLNEIDRKTTIKMDKVF